MVRKERLEKKWRRTRGKRKGGIVEEKDGRKEERMDGGMEGVKEFREKEGLRRGEKITDVFIVLVLVLLVLGK